MSVKGHNLDSVKSVNTKPEMYVRSGLHRSGLRFRIHNKKLTSTPDLFFARYNLCLFVHGCFWHKHECHLFKWPGTREEFWRKKITGNHLRDQKQYKQLLDDGYRVGVIWECSIKGKKSITEENFFAELIRNIRSDVIFFQMPK